MFQLQFKQSVRLLTRKKIILFWILYLKQSTPNSSVPFATFRMHVFNLLHWFADSAAAPIKRCNTYVACLCLPLAVCRTLISFTISKLSLTSNHLSFFYRVFHGYIFCEYTYLEGFHSTYCGHQYARLQDRWTMNQVRRLH